MGKFFLFACRNMRLISDDLQEANMAYSESIIRHPSQLNNLSRLPLLRVRGVGTIRLQGEISGHPAQPKWEADLNRYYFACGCDTSAKCLTAVLLIVGAWSVFSYFQGELSFWAALQVSLGSAIAGAVAGKFFGLWRANNKLKQTISEIQSQWKPAEEPEPDRWSCG